jgi:xanthosine utilization system XapX-like protein
MSTVRVDFGQSFIAGTAFWATFVGMSRIIVHFKPATTYYLLLVYAAGLFTTTVLFADLNVRGPKPAAISIAWTMAGMATDLPLILIYHIRCSCIFSASVFRLNILKGVTTLVFMLITTFFSLMLTQFLRGRYTRRNMDTSISSTIFSYH